MTLFYLQVFICLYVFFFCSSLFLAIYFFVFLHLSSSLLLYLIHSLPLPLLLSSSFSLFISVLLSFSLCIPLPSSPSLLPSVLIYLPFPCASLCFLALHCSILLDQQIFFFSFSLFLSWSLLLPSYVILYLPLSYFLLLSVASSLAHIHSLFVSLSSSCLFFCLLCVSLISCVPCSSGSMLNIFPPAC